MCQSVQENMNCGLSLQKLLLSQQNHRQLLSHHQGAGVETLLEQNRRLQHPSPLDTLLEHSYASGFRTHQVPYRIGARFFSSLTTSLCQRSCCGTVTNFYDSGSPTSDFLQITFPVSALARSRICVFSIVHLHRQKVVNYGCLAVTFLRWNNVLRRNLLCTRLYVFNRLSQLFYFYCFAQLFLKVPI